jgi:uncharacterized protein (TIGR02145 family)
MKTRPINRPFLATICLPIFFACTYNSYAQKDVIELTFKAIIGSDHVQLDSIKVMNRTEGSDTVLYWPDTVLSLYYVAIPEVNQSMDGFQVFQNFPNPVKDQTTISVDVPEKDRVNLLITDPTGRLIYQYEKTLEKGVHYFKFIPGADNLYLCTAQWRGETSSIKILHAITQSNSACTLEYLGNDLAGTRLKSSDAIQSFLYGLGDELLCIGYTNNLQSGILYAPEGDQLYSFQFATNIPCPGTPTVYYGGQVYNTIQIFSQCWLNENLNVGTILNGEIEMTDNGIIEKYCYNNDPDSCVKYGALYQWWEAMQYSTQPGSQGICPPGWHLPMDDEYKVLEGAVDSYYGIGSPEWEKFGFWSGVDAGINLKATTGWQYNGNGLDNFGFAALPGGERLDPNYFSTAGILGSWWTSDEFTSGYTAMSRALLYDQWGSFRANYNEYWGFSVRCLKDQ